MKTPVGNELLVVGYMHDRIVLTWLARNTTRVPICVRAQRTIACDTLEVYKGILYNLTKIRMLITDFIDAYQLHECPSAWWISQPTATEQYIGQVDAFVSRAHFQQYVTGSDVWDYRYLYPHENGSFIFYLARVPHWIVLQYQLLAHATASSVIVLTTDSLALIQLYRFVNGASFRGAKLAHDLAQHNNNLHPYFTRALISRMVSFNTPEPESLQDCLPALGLFVCESIPL